MLLHFLDYCSIVVNHVLYWSFDSLENLNLSLWEANREADFNPQVVGKANYKHFTLLPNP